VQNKAREVSILQDDSAQTAACVYAKGLDDGFQAAIDGRCDSAEACSLNS
jgi:hypothetical protein